MRREWQEERTLELEDGRALGLDYWLLTDETCWGESYGVSVTDSAGQEEAVRHITTRRAQALALLERMARCTVTTVTAAEVVSDFLAE